MKQLLLATNNPGKILEICSILNQVLVNSENQEWQLVTPADLGINIDIHEDGTTYAENAAKKALSFCQYSHITSLADDTGLEVDALDGEPGLRSARYSKKPGATDVDRRAFLLEKLAEFPRPWQAHFTCTVAIAALSGEVFLTEGICHGEIIPEEKGDHGFGYDPIFFIPNLNRTMAELTMEEKNRISHRAIAVKKAAQIITTMQIT